MTRREREQKVEIEETEQRVSAFFVVFFLRSSVVIFFPQRREALTDHFSSNSNSNSRRA